MLHLSNYVIYFVRKVIVWHVTQQFVLNAFKKITNLLKLCNIFLKLIQEKCPFS